ncbi:family 78 glycoside hydrolase catalytic domain [Candidatus Neomarinimicrobiota bacterium]
MAFAFTLITYNGCASLPGGRAATAITNLRVAYLDVPLAVDDEKPVFSWQMMSSVTGQKQNAYQMIVTSESDRRVVWNSGRVESGLSHDIRYDGSALSPETAYSWELTVWDAAEQAYKENSRFETGLMNPDLRAWDGAEWIGTNHLILDATSACVFEINTDFQITRGTAASVILGANDFRFSDRFLNIENIEGENYIRFELDIAGADTPSGTALNIYRVGYGANDSPTTPYQSISAANYPGTNINDIITAANKNDVHNLSIYVETGNITVQIDSQTVLTAAAPPPGGTGGRRGGGGSRLTISNYSTGNNYNTYPNLNSVGFASNPGDEVVFTNYKILNRGQSNPDNNILFDAVTGPTYALFEGLPGISLARGGTAIRVVNTADAMTVAYADPSHGGLTMLRTEFSTDMRQSVAKAKMYVTSMGSYEVYFNGQRVGDDWFAPGDSQFRETLCYYAYDVTDLIVNGPNSMGAILNPGWYTGYMTFSPGNFNFFGDTEALLAKLVVTYADGSSETLISNADAWRIYKNGPVEAGSFFQGERYNAGKEANISLGNNLNAWSTVAYDDSEWLRAEVVEQREWIDFDIVGRYDPPVRVAQVLQATEVLPVHSTDEHTYTYNMGVNMVGVPSVTIPAGWLQAGDVVIMLYGEQLYPGFPGDDQQYVDLYGSTGEGRAVAGRILTETYRASLSTDFYTAKNNAEVTIQPSSTYRGYQYIQITIPNHEGPLPIENVRGLVLSSDRLPTGTYEAATSDGISGTLVNQLMKNIQRSQLGNFFTIPTDCPQRNERMGWTGDAQAYSRTATYNSDVRNFFRQWMVALRNDQSDEGGIGSTVPTYSRSDATGFANGTTWAAAVCMVPWQLYIQYGDTQIIEENMETMRAWLDGMDRYDFSTDYTYLSDRTGGLSDWLAVDNNTPAELVNNAIYIYMMEVTAIMAEAIGNDDYATTLRERHDNAKAEWNEVYVDPATGKTKNADGSLVHSQTSYATPLNFNAFSADYLEQAQAYLAELATSPSMSGEGQNTYPDYSITTGFSGTPNILPALSRSGNVEEAYNMFTCTEYASWLYPVTKGATTVWERWDGYERAFAENNSNSMNSFNHFALGAVGQWMYEYQLGITGDHKNGEAGYKHFILQPTAGGNYTALRGSYSSNYCLYCNC